MTASLVDLRRRRKRGAILLVIAALWRPTVACASDDVRIVVAYTFINTEIAPKRATYTSYAQTAYLVSPDKTIKVAASQIDRGRSYGDKASYALGEGRPHTMPDGEIFVVTGHIDDTGAIVVTGDTGSYQIVTRITTNGVDSCSATRDYRLKPGHKVFEVKRLSNHEPMLVSDMHAEHVSCKISSVADK